jgi:O-antigen ligase
MGAIFYRFKNKAPFKAFYLDLIMICCMLIPILSATRSYVIAYFTLFSAYAILSSGKVFKGISITIISSVLLYLLLSNSIIQGQFIGSLKRLETVELLIAGDLSAGGTLDRITEYTPILLDHWKESPLFGWGFSSFFASENNGHAGLANLLFNVGIFGFIIFIIYWGSLIWIPLRTSLKLDHNNPYKKSLLVLVFVFFSYFIINNAGQQFTYLIGFMGTGYSQMIFLSFSDFAIRESQRVNRGYQSSI